MAISFLFAASTTSSLSNINRALRVDHQSGCAAIDHSVQRCNADHGDIEAHILFGFAYLYDRQACLIPQFPRSSDDGVGAFHRFHGHDCAIPHHNGLPYIHCRDLLSNRASIIHIGFFGGVESSARQGPLGCQVRF